MSNSESQLFEIFSSIQGEGIYVGRRQIFIRFLMCNLNCAYCDTKESLIPQKNFRVEETPGKKDFKFLQNPATIDQVMDMIIKFNKTADLHHSVSITGGEPLLQVDFLKNLLPKIKEKGIKIYLETNGTMSERLSEVVELVDYVAMDIKLPSVTGGSDLLSEHKKALTVAALSDVFIKMVVGKESKPVEIESASKMIAEISVKIPLVIQPVTPIREVKHGPTPEQLLVFHSIAKRHLEDVRVIPQMHRAMGLV